MVQVGWFQGFGRIPFLCDQFFKSPKFRWNFSHLIGFTRKSYSTLVYGVLLLFVVWFFYDRLL